ncbi:MAG: hypothetical protein AB7V13_27530, partial [Pseudorhodoplanes sp.]
PTLAISSSDNADLNVLSGLIRTKALHAKQEKDPRQLAFHSAPSTVATVRSDRRGSAVTFGALLNSYLKANADPALLAGFNGDARIQSLEPSGERDTKIIDIRRIGYRPRNAEELATAADQIGVDGPKLITAPPEQDSSPTEIGAIPNQAERRNVRVKLASKSLSIINLAEPGVLDTFGYCERVRDAHVTPGVFDLERCVVDAAGRIPAKIRNLEPFIIDVGKFQASTPTILDKLLTTSGYSVPYPVEWGMPAASRVEISAGKLVKILEQPIAIVQWGLPGCQAIATPTLDNVLKETFSFPENPCFAYDVALPTVFYGATPPIAVDGCMPGSTNPVDAVDGKIRCVVTTNEVKSGKKRISLVWSEGFEQIVLELPIGAKRSTRLEVTKENLADILRASDVELMAPRPGEPTYKPVEVLYRVGKEACGKGVPLSEKVGMPSLREAGCVQLPSSIEFTMELDKERTNADVPLEAFETRVRHTLVLADKGKSAPFQASRARRSLPVAFSPERQQRYSRQYSEATDLLVKGARIFNDAGCTQQSGDRSVELFARPSGKAGYQWPVWARVLDNDGQPLTNCAKAVIENGTAGLYLTFDFVSTRAVGRRRVVILARSRDFMNKRGMPKALNNALSRFLEVAKQAYERGAPLSPIDFMIVSEDGTMRRIFTGEQTVLEPESVQASLASLDRTGPKVPDLSLLRLQPETKDAERIIIVMDGSLTTARNASELRLLGSDLSVRQGSGLQFFLSSDSCELWTPHSPQLICVDVGALPQGKREEIFLSAFAGLLNGAELADRNAKKSK